MIKLMMYLRALGGVMLLDCVLYYTPNRKTMIGRMNSYVNEDGEIVVTIYKTGTFLLAYEPEPEEEEENTEAAEEEEA